MRTKATSILLILMLALTGAAMAQQAEKWIHIRVEENAGDRDAETVTVNLPLSLVSAAVALIPQEVTDEAISCLETAKRTGRVIVGTSNYFVPHTPVENVIALIETLREHR